jgi:two-component system KDP operon response regulator KdpE
MRKYLILVVDDETRIVRFVRARLQEDGYQVVTANTGEEALKVVEEESPDLVILDIMMPGIDGFETLRRIRRDSDIPVIMLSARMSDADRIRGFDNGADDYVVKPFNPDELAARVEAVLRRTARKSTGRESATLRYPGCTIDLQRRSVHVGDEEVRLSKTEWELLSMLAANAGKVLTHRELLSRVWGPAFADEPTYLRTWISRLRSKIEPDPADPVMISTFPGLGYRLEAPPTP